MINDYLGWCAFCPFGACTGKDECGHLLTLLLHIHVQMCHGAQTYVQKTFWGERRKWWNPGNDRGFASTLLPGGLLNFYQGWNKKYLEFTLPCWCSKGHCARAAAKALPTWAGGGGCCTKPWGGGGGCSTCWDTGGPEPVKPPGGSCWLGEAMM